MIYSRYGFLQSKISDVIHIKGFKKEPLETHQNG